MAGKDDFLTQDVEHFHGKELVADQKVDAALFPRVSGASVTAPGLSPSVVLYILVDEPVVPFLEVRPPVLLWLNVVLG